MKITEYSNARRSHTARFIHLTPNIVSFVMVGDEKPLVLKRDGAQRVKDHLRKSGWRCVRQWSEKNT